MARRPIQLDLPDLNGTTALVTGASDGIGLVIATRLAQAGAELLLPVRNRAKGEKAVQTIREKTPSASVGLYELDLSSLASVEALGQVLREEAKPIHLLVNNAGVMTPPDHQTTADGFELQFGTNHLGHFALVGHLLSLLREGRARVVTQTSIAARSASINWDDLNWQRSYDGMKAYAQSKLACGLFGIELDRLSQAHDWGITSSVSHPGVAPTNLLAARKELGRSHDTVSRTVIARLSSWGILVGTVESAALPALLAATAPDSEHGSFYGPVGPGQAGGAPGRPIPFAPLLKAEDAARLWRVSEELTGVRYPRG